MSSATPNWSRPQLVELPKQSLRNGSVESLLNDIKDTLTEGQREHHFKATDPPHLAPAGRSDAVAASESTLISIEPSSEESPRTANPLLRNHGHELAELTKEWGSLSSEGRKQAEEAGLKLGCSIKRPISHSPPEIPQKKAHQDRWAAYSRTDPDPHLQEVSLPTEDKSDGADDPSEPHRPLLEVFEAELAKLLSDSPGFSTPEMTESSELPPELTTECLAPETIHDPSTSETPNIEIQDSPVEPFGEVVRGFIDGIGLLTSEIRSNIPEAHEQLLNAQRNFPHAVQQTVLGALRGWGSHVHRIADNLQQASIATRNAADRTRGLDTQALEGVVSGLHGLAVGIGDIGGALFPGRMLGSTFQSSDVQAEYTTESGPAVAEATIPAAELAHKAEVTVQDERQTVDIAATLPSQGPIEDCTQPNLAYIKANSTSNDSLAHARGKYTDGEYENIHRTKREEAADRREADRQRVRRMQQEADEAYPPSDTSTSSFVRERQPEEAVQLEPGHTEKEYDQLKTTRTSEVAPTTAEKGNYHPKPHCSFGCTSSSSCRHRRAPGGSPYPSRNDFYRSRHTRRSPLQYTSQLPYEYVVPPPDFYNTSHSDLTSDSLRHNGGRTYGRSRLPANSLRRASQGPSTSLSDWPKVQRYGPIHLPDSAHRPSDNTWTSQLPRSRSPRSLSPPGRWTDSGPKIPRIPTSELPGMDRPSAPARQPISELPWVHSPSQPARQPRPETPWVDPRSQASRQPIPETSWANAHVATTPTAYCPSGSQCGLIPADPTEGPISSRNDVGHHASKLRHRQSWHPSSASKTPERWNMIIPERSTVSFAESSGESSLPTWNPVLQHRRSTGLFTAPKVPYSAAKDLPLSVSGAQAKATRPNGQTNSAIPVYPWYYSPHGTAHGELDNEEVGRVARDSVGSFNSKHFVEPPWNDARSSLQPSLVNHSDLPRRAATFSRTTPKGGDDLFSNLPSLSSVLESLPVEKIAPELKRFPTLAQFENEASKSIPPFPPLPTMEPLIPLRTDAKYSGVAVLKDAAKTERQADGSTRRSSSLTAVSTQADAAEIKESSGQFFHRMTGLGASSVAHQNAIASTAVGLHSPPVHGADGQNEERQDSLRLYKCPMCDKAFHQLEHLKRHGRTHTGWEAHEWSGLAPAPLPAPAPRPSRQDSQTGLEGHFLNEAPESTLQRQPIRPAKLKPEQGDARLTRPFDPLAESVTLHRSRLIDNFRRTTAQRRSFHDYYAGNRRPYSEYFTGNGRLGWESFLAKQDGVPSRLSPTSKHASPSEPIEKSAVSETKESTPRCDAAIDHSGEHQDATTVEKVQECVDQLISLGFGTMENGGQARLLVYAQAAEGDLEDAIETIEEERKAYEQRSQD